jgi:hypothetical protein
MATRSIGFVPDRVQAPLGYPGKRRLSGLKVCDGCFDEFSQSSCSGSALIRAAPAFGSRQLPPRSVRDFLALTRTRWRVSGGLIEA